FPGNASAPRPVDRCPATGGPGIARPRAELDGSRHLSHKRDSEVTRVDRVACVSVHEDTLRSFSGTESVHYAIMSPVSRRRTPVLVGRRAELGTLDEALANVRARRGDIVVVQGEAGIGKSRLVEDFVARTDDALAVIGNCVDAAT